MRKVWACLQDVYHVLASELVGDAVDAGRSSVEEVVSLSVDMQYKIGHYLILKDVLNISLLECKVSYADVH